MRFTTLTLHRFRSAESLTLPELGARVLLAGRNGSGKTSIREALRWLLLGRCLGTDAKGTGWEALAPSGDALEVSGDLTPLGSIRRAYKGPGRVLTVSGVTGESGIHQQAILEKLGTTPAFLEAVLSTESFLALHHAEAKRLVLGLLNVQVPVEGVLRSLDEVEALYETAFADRKVVKVRLRTHTVPPAPTEVFPTLQAIDEQLAKLRAELQTVTQAAGSALGQRAALQRQLAGLALEPVPAIDVGELTKWEARLAAAPEGHTLSLLPVTEGATPEQIRWRIEALRDHKPKGGCVLDPEVPCETAKVRFTTRAKLLEATLPPERPAPEAIDRAAIQSTVDGLRRRRDEAVATQTRNSERERTAQAIRQQLAEMPPDQAAAEVDGLQARIRKGELLRDRAQSYWLTISRRTQAETEHAQLEAEVKRLEDRCELLGPNGVRLEALQTAIGRFEAQVNEYTAPFGWQLRFVMDPWLVLVNERPAETYSESEQFRIGVALQLAIAQLSGLSFAVVDRLDMLDVQNRQAVSAMLIHSPLEQVIILATREPEQALPSAVQAYRLALVEGRTAIAESNRTAEAVA